MYEFIVGKPPFETETMEGTYDRIRKVQYDFPEHVTPAARDLISRVLRKVPRDRLPLENIMCHEWMTANGIVHRPSAE